MKDAMMMNPRRFQRPRFLTSPAALYFFSLARTGAPGGDIPIGGDYA